MRVKTAGPLREKDAGTFVLDTGQKWISAKINALTSILS